MPSESCSNCDHIFIEDEMQFPCTSCKKRICERCVEDHDLYDCTERL